MLSFAVTYAIVFVLAVVISWFVGAAPGMDIEPVPVPELRLRLEAGFAIGVVVAIVVAVYVMRSILRKDFRTFRIRLVAR